MRNAILLALAVGLIGAAIAAVVTRRHDEGPMTLASAEVREYQGQKLSSINDFEDNSIKGTQYVDKDTYRLDVSGLVANPGSYTYDQIVDGHQHYQKVVGLDCVEGWSVNILWEGVRVQDLIDEAQPSPDARVLIFHAADGYTSSLPIEYFRDKDIIMALQDERRDAAGRARLPVHARGGEQVGLQVGDVGHGHRILQRHLLQGLLGGPGLLQQRRP